MRGMRVAMLVVALEAVAALFLVGSAWAQHGNGTYSESNSMASDGADKLYVLYCGQGHTEGQERWSPGVFVGKPIDISDNCYLIHDNASGYFLWDTGISDYVASMPNGWQNGPLLWTRTKTLASQLAALHVDPSDIKLIGISHTHPDHIGNAELFPQTKIIMGKAEAAMYFGPKGFVQPTPGDPRPTFSKDHPLIKADEDYDAFGDGNIIVLATPGHTPGHQSALVHLKKTGWIILTGDAVHLQGNWDNRRVPAMGGEPDDVGIMIRKLQTLTSMQRLADLISFYHAQLWINHEMTQSAKRKMSPEFYE